MSSPHAYLTKITGPAVSADALGPVDAVLISHRRCPAGWGRRRWDWRPGSRTSLPTAPEPLRCKLFRQFTALPTGNASGHINCEVTGFVLSGPGLPTVYLSGDNASMSAVKNVADRVRGIDVAVLFAGGERADQRTRSTADP